MCMRPLRHWMQNPQNTCPSAETNAPSLTWCTSGPVATTCPATSCPNVMGVRIRCAAHSFHW